MNKQHILSVIDKYYLNGLIENARWKVENKEISIPFKSPNKDMVGLIKASAFELEDCEIAIYSTSQLYKLVNITDKFVTLDLLVEHKTPTKLLIADLNYNLEYSLANLMMVGDASLKEEPEYEYEFKIDREFIDKFVKAKKALSTSNISIEVEYNEEANKEVKFTLGDNNNYSNKIEFITPATKMEIPSSTFMYNAEYLKEIFETNKDIKSGTCYLSEQGLMKINIQTENIESFYYLLAKE